MHIAVIGAGLMGHGIALSFAVGCHTVAVHDAYAAARSGLPARLRATAAVIGAGEDVLARIRITDTLADAVEPADFIVDAVAEDLEVKQILFREIETLCGRDAILASNTSVIPITRIMEGLTHRERALGTHWWNPPHLIPLVEVIGTQWTDPAIIEQVIALHRGIGKTPVHVRRDVPGFIGNRLQHALWREAISLVENGICDAETVDTVVKQSFGRRLAVLGPLENVDLIGTELTLAIHQTLLPHIDHTPGPAVLLRDLVAAGKRGMSSGEGFRSWTPEQAEAVRASLNAHLVGGLAASLEDAAKKTEKD